MKKPVLFFLLFILCIQISSAQKVAEINKKAKENQSGSSDRNSSNSGNSSGGVGLVGDIIGGFFRLIFSGIFRSNLSPEERAYRQEQKMAKRETGKLNPLLGLDLIFDYGGVPNLYQSYRPRARGRVGIFSTDIRYAGLTEKRLAVTDQYNTLDWQVLQIHPVNLPVASWRLGFGLMREYTTSTSHPEFATGLDLFFNKQSIKFAPEFRYAYDPGGIAPRMEWNGELAYGLINRKHIKMYLGINGMYARYYESVDVWTAGFGLRMKFQ